MQEHITCEKGWYHKFSPGRTSALFNASEGMTTVHALTKKLKTNGCCMYNVGGSGNATDRRELNEVNSRSAELYKACEGINPVHVPAGYCKICRFGIPDFY